MGITPKYMYDFPYDNAPNTQRVQHFEANNACIQVQNLLNFWIENSGKINNFNSVHKKHEARISPIIKDLLHH